ncbi:MAG: hypothetical protein ACI85V_002629 [bacterium]|jgi:hypothetical protein
MSTARQRMSICTREDFKEAGKRQLVGDTVRADTTDEVKDLRREARTLKEVFARQTLELRLHKGSMTDRSRDIVAQYPVGQWNGSNARRSKRDACITSNPPHNETNQMSQMLS